MRKFLVVFAEYNSEEEALKRAEELEDETGYSFYIKEVETDDS